MTSTRDPSGPRKLVTFLIGAHEFCVDIMAVREIRGWTPATPLPHAPEWVRGVINLRGAVLSIVDLGVRLGGASTGTPSARHVVIVVQIGERVTGLLVDAVTGILSVEPGRVLPPTGLARGAEARTVEGVIAVDDRMISLLDLADVLPPVERAAA